MIFGSKKEERVFHILMVEDFPQNQILYRALFEDEGFKVTLLEHADPPFVETVAKIQPDLITMDLMLGKDGAPAEREGFDGIQVLKDDSRTAGIPIFVMSSFSNARNVNRAKELGAIDYFNTSGVNPVEIPGLIKKFFLDKEKYRPVHPLMR